MSATGSFLTDLMTKEIIHFAHANSFPAKTYNKLFSFLEDEYEINYLERHAHNPLFPVTDGWERLRDELRAELESRYSKPIIGIGHSLGGILHFLTAVENPHLYKAIVLLDSPFVSRLSGFGLNFLKKTKLVDKYTPSRIARFRKNFWKTKEDVFEHFRQKPLFQNFDADVLRDYANFATVETGKGFKLLFDPRIEAHIYRTIPHSFTKHRRKLKVPTAYIGGKHSREARWARLSFMQKNFPVNFYFTEGTHLFPLEYPEKTAEIIKNAVKHLSK